MLAQLFAAYADERRQEYATFLPFDIVNQFELLKLSSSVQISWKSYTEGRIQSSDFVATKNLSRPKHFLNDQYSCRATNFWKHFLEVPKIEKRKMTFFSSFGWKSLIGRMKENHEKHKGKPTRIGSYSYQRKDLPTNCYEPTTNI